MNQKISIYNLRIFFYLFKHDYFNKFKDVMPKKETNTTPYKDAVQEMLKWKDLKLTKRGYELSNSAIKLFTPSLKKLFLDKEQKIINSIKNKKIDSFEGILPIVIDNKLYENNDKLFKDIVNENPDIFRPLNKVLNEATLSADLKQKTKRNIKESFEID
jgi:hypothetical protein